MLSANHITKQYRLSHDRKHLFTAVSDVSLTLPDNSITALVGESGCGKSTLVRMLAYVERPDTGQVLLDGDDITFWNKKQLCSIRGAVQLVMQDAAGSLDPRQTIRMILEEPLMLLFHAELSSRKNRIEELLAVTQLGTDVLDKKPHELSGGQQKRVCIARALAANPKHIIFDESFSGLDVTLKKELLTLLKTIQCDMQLNYLIITHDLDTAMYMADTIHVMYAGKIIETVHTPKSFTDFRAPYSRQLVDAVLAKRTALQ